MTLGVGVFRPSNARVHDGIELNFLNQRRFQKVAGQNPTFGDPADVLARTTASKWALGASGLLAPSGVNQLAYEWTPGGIPRGLSIETGATNALLRSEDFSATEWFAQGLRAFGSGSTVNAAVAPDGASTADLITEDSTTGLHRVLNTFNVTTGTWTYSVFLKRPPTNAKRWFFLAGFVVTGSLLYGAVFDLQTGAVGTSIYAGTTPRIVAYPNGWFRVSITFAVAGASSSQQICAMVNGDNFNSYTGDNASGLLLWGAQAELNAGASSYIPTTTAAVARATDTINFTPAGGEVSSSEGSLVCEFEFNWLNPANINPALSRGGIATMAFQNVGTRLSAYDGTNTAALPIGTIAANRVYRLGVSWGGAAANLFLVGEQNGTVQSATSAFAGSFGTGAITLGNWYGVCLNGWLRRAEFWPTRQSDAAITARVT